MKIARYKRHRKSFPYYKVQYWDERWKAWHDIQRTFPNHEAAVDYGKAQVCSAPRFRIMEVQRSGRRPVAQYEIL